MRLAWATDIHLNFLDETALQQFHREVAATQAEAVVITGDIGEASDVGSLLVALAEHVCRPVYFVLGNHDFYGGSIAQVRSEMATLSANHRWLRWMPAIGVTQLTAATTLIGHDGWADGRLGDYANSPVMLNDFFKIEELLGLTPIARLAKLNALGDEAALHFEQMLPKAAFSSRNLLVLTHVPPFREACWHEGQISNDDFLPHFSAEAPGLVLREFARCHPDVQTHVLCGHTHGEGMVQVLPNLSVRTGGAEYGAPKVEVIDVD